MDGQLVHFELPAQDAGRAQEFWKSLFGWKIRTWDGPVEYHMLEGNEPGGAIYPDAEAAGSGPVVYFSTSDIGASISKVRELGDVLAMKADGRRSEDEITTFDSTGLAIQDLAIALVALERREELDLPTIEL